MQLGANLLGILQAGLTDGHHHHLKESQRWCFAIIKDKNGNTVIISRAQILCKATDKDKADNDL